MQSVKNNDEDEEKCREKPRSKNNNKTSINKLRSSPRYKHKPKIMRNWRVVETPNAIPKENPHPNRVTYHFVCPKHQNPINAR